MREEKNAAADDGRTIADMNVEGMPWYVPREEAGGPKAAAGEPEAPARPAAAEEEEGVYGKQRKRACEHRW